MLFRAKGVLLTVMKRWPRLRIAITATMCLAPAAVECQVTVPSTRGQTRVVSLQTLRPETPWSVTSERIYNQRLSDALGDRLDYNAELLNVYHFPDALYESQFEDYLVRKYHNRPIDLLLANGPTAIAVAGRLQTRLASHPPIVFSSASAPPVGKSTGHTYRYAMKGSLDLALRVHPDIRHVYLVCGTSPEETGTKPIFTRRCRCRRPAWSSPICAGSPWLR